MAWEQMMVVRQSNLYEHKGLAKPLLALIALLIIGPPAEGKEPDKDEGFCVATQAYLAASLGCSDTEVKRLTKIFETDGWIQVIRYRDHRGYQRNRYRIVDVEKIKERAMQRDPETHEFIRGTSPNKRRTTSWVHGDTRESSGHLDMPHEVTLIPGLRAPCTNPGGTVPASVGFREVNQKVKAEEGSSAAAAFNSHTSCVKTSGTSSLKPDTARDLRYLAVTKTVIPAESAIWAKSELPALRRRQAELCAAELEELLRVAKQPQWTEDFLSLLSKSETPNFGAPRLRRVMYFALATLPEEGDDFWLRRTTSAKSFIKHFQGEALRAQLEQFHGPLKKPR
jgi:hypothetical protein